MLGPGAGFFTQLAQGGIPQVFALIDAALGHLPPVAFLVVDAAADEHLAIAIHQHHPHAGSVPEFAHL